MDQLRAMRVFSRVVEEGSFAAAARSLDIAPAAVTRLVAELERTLGARLMNRTTRRLVLTGVGAAYLDRVRLILSDLDEVQAMVSMSTGQPRGLVRMRVPSAVSVHQLARHMPRLRERYPHLAIEIDAAGVVEAMDESYDLSIAFMRTAPQGDLIARRLARSEVILCASPEYLDRRGRPERPSELATHDAMLPQLSDVKLGMTFHRGPWGRDERSGEFVTVDPGAAALRTTHVETNYVAALAGLGVTALPSFIVEAALAARTLERVLPGWQLYTGTLWAMYPSRKYFPARTRAVLDFLLEIFGGEDKDPWLEWADDPPVMRPTIEPAA